MLCGKILFPSHLKIHIQAAAILPLDLHPSDYMSLQARDDISSCFLYFKVLITQKEACLYHNNKNKDAEEPHEVADRASWIQVSALACYKDLKILSSHKSFIVHLKRIFIISSDSITQGV